MLDVNEYFDGKVKSISINTATLPATIGAMAPGNYEFGTDTKEIMTIVSGEMKVKLPGEDEWQTFIEGQVFEVEAKQHFSVETSTDTAYLCQYIS